MMTNEELLQQNKELKIVLQSLISWQFGSECNDCTPFYLSRSSMYYEHAKGCGVLKTINEAQRLLGLEEWEGYDFPETPEAHAAERVKQIAEINARIK